MNKWGNDNDKLYEINKSRNYILNFKLHNKLK